MTDPNEVCGNCDKRRFFHNWSGYCPILEEFSSTEKFRPTNVFQNPALDFSSVGADGYHPPRFTIEDLAPDGKLVALDPARFDRAIHAVTGKEVRELGELRRELKAVRVLDAWAKKHAHRTNEPGECVPVPMCSIDAAGREHWSIYVFMPDTTAAFKFGSAAACRIAAADALLKEDPSLGSEV